MPFLKYSILKSLKDAYTCTHDLGSDLKAQIQTIKARNTCFVIDESSFVLVTGSLYFFTSGTDIVLPVHN